VLMKAVTLTLRNQTYKLDPRVLLARVNADGNEKLLTRYSIQGRHVYQCEN
jgi:hypothetical protein